MRKTAAVLVLLFLSSLAFASDARVDSIVSEFNKTKNKTKAKHGVVKQYYRNVQAEAVVRADRRTYSGRYAVEDLDFALDLEVASNGSATGSGADQGRTFTLRNGRVEGALLTATKVYRDGSTAPLEGAFLTLRVRTGTTPSNITDDHTESGLGITGLDIHVHSIDLTKLFYRAER